MDEFLGRTTKDWQAISSFATVLLVLITGVYAFLTYLMVKAVKRTGDRAAELAEAQLAVEFDTSRPASTALFFQLTLRGASVIVRLVFATCIHLDRPKDPRVIILQPLGQGLLASLREGNILTLIADEWPDTDTNTYIAVTVSYAFSRLGPQHDATVTLQPLQLSE